MLFCFYRSGLRKSQVLGYTVRPYKALNYRSLSVPLRVPEAFRVVTRACRRPRSKMGATRPNRKAAKSIPEKVGDKKQKITIRVINGRSVRKRPFLSHGRRKCLSALAPFAQKSSQFQQSVDPQTKPEIDQGSDVKLERMMFSGLRQVGVEGEIQAVA